MEDIPKSVDKLTTAMPTIGIEEEMALEKRASLRFRSGIAIGRAERASASALLREEETRFRFRRFSFAAGRRTFFTVPGASQSALHLRDASDARPRVCPFRGALHAARRRIRQSKQSAGKKGPPLTQFPRYQSSHGIPWHMRR